MNYLCQSNLNVVKYNKLTPMPIVQRFLTLKMQDQHFSPLPIHSASSHLESEGTRPLWTILFCLAIGNGTTTLNKDVCDEHIEHHYLIMIKKN